MVASLTTKLGRNSRWLEQASIQAIQRYRNEREQARAMLPPGPERDYVLGQLAVALQARTEYIIWLSENSEQA